MKHYSSDISESQWVLLKGILYFYFKNLNSLLVLTVTTFTMMLHHYFFDYWIDGFKLQSIPLPPSYSSKYLKNLKSDR
jgi:hypothetical protein